ncbi:MAG TPA: mechanosensitive ion channel family protein, partial [Polyangiaceae bacterium]|nr:mechanosensitive ion channel family protein [Polyangiaceae bacterium]
FALALALAARLVLPAHEKKYVRGPLLLLLLYVASVAVRAALPKGSPAQGPLGLFGLFVLLCSIGRSGFLLIVFAALARRFAFPLPKIVQDIIQLAIYLAIALFTLRASGVQPGSLLATSALLTAVIGLSLQDTLGNLFAGLAIQAQRPFEVGDWIQFDDKNDHVGKVVEINWRATRVVTLDHVEVTVPNGTLAKAPIVNYTKPTPIARRKVIMIAPNTQPPGSVQKLLLEAVANVPGVLQTPEADVILRDFNERGAEYEVRFFITDFDRRERIGAQVRERLWYALRRGGVPIPLPGRLVDMRELSPAREQREREQQALERERALTQVDFLRVLPEDALRELALRVKTRLYSKGETILRQGEIGHELFIVQSGEVSVVLDREDAAEVALATLGPGKFFGEMSLMTGEPRRATVRARSESEVLVVGKAEFQDILAQHETLLNKISEVLATRDEALDAEREQPGADEAAVQSARGQVLLQRIREFFSL